jgi:signal peptidase I
MAPLVNKGNTLVFSSIGQQQLKAGDIVLFPGKEIPFVAHRIIQIKNHGKKNQYLIKGDNTLSTDGWFTKQELYAVAKTILKKHHRTINLQSWQWRFLSFLVLYLPGFRTLLSAIKVVYNRYHDKKKHPTIIRQQAIHCQQKKSHQKSK